MQHKIEDFDNENLKHMKLELKKQKLFDVKKL